MLDDPYPRAATLTDILVFARSGPSLDELLAYFTARALEVLDCDDVEVCAGPAAQGVQDAHDGSAKPHVSSHVVSCGSTPWGELRLTYLDGPVTIGDIHRGRLLAEILGAALASAQVESWGPVMARGDPAAPGVHAGHPDPDDLVALVLDVAETLDGMPDASTRARLALVVSRLVATVGGASWFVGVAHDGRLYDVSAAGGPVAADAGFGGSAASRGSVLLSDFPARRRASEGGAFYADRWTGDDAQRCTLLGNGHAAVIGAGGYDLDGRSWVVEVFADTGARLEHVTPVLAALVQEALSFPREAVVPRPQEPWVRAIFTCPRVGRSDADVRGIGAVG